LPYRICSKDFSNGSSAWIRSATASLNQWKKQKHLYIHQGCQIFLSTKTKTGKNTKLLRTMPNVHKTPITKDSKMDQVSIKYTNIFHCKTLQNLPKFGFSAWKQTIWQPWHTQEATESMFQRSEIWKKLGATDIKLKHRQVHTKYVSRANGWHSRFVLKR
jgi:hypothetical protein